MNWFQVKIYFDGGCRPNPGRMEIAAVARGCLDYLPDAGFGNSEEAEWLALLRALEVARRIGAPDVLLLGDSRSVINQAVNGAKCRSPELREYRDRFGLALRGFDRARVRYVKRSQNLAGIALGHIRQGRMPSGLHEEETA